MERISQLERDYVNQVLDNAFATSLNSVFNNRLETAFAKSLTSLMPLDIVMVLPLCIQQWRL